MKRTWNVMKNFNLYLLIFLLYFVTTIIRVIPDGFHPDSLVYMSMAVDVADGSSSFWHLHFTDALFKNFYEHPPLGILTMSLPFYIFGDTLLVDKLYGIFFGVFIAFVIAAIIGLVLKEQKRNALLLALFYFLAFPITGNTLENNLLEIPATLFILLSVYLFLKYVLTLKNRVLYSALFTLSIFGAFLVKGPVTIFPLALPFFYFLLFSSTYSFKEMLKFYGVTALFTLLFGTILSLYPGSNHYLTSYFQNQIVSSIDGSRGGDEHFKLTSQLLTDLGSIFFISFLAVSVSQKKFVKFPFSKLFWLFILIGLSGSLPLEVSPRQHDYYIFPSLAFFAIALATLFVQPVSLLLNKLHGHKFIALLNTILLLASIAVTNDKLHTNSRYKNFYSDIVNTHVNIEKNSKISTCVSNPTDYDKFYNNIGLKANLKRHFRAEITKESKEENYYLTTKSSLKECQPDMTKYLYIGRENADYYLIYKRVVN